MKPTILLTGGTGFIGKHFIEFLVADGYHVVSISRTEQRPAESVTPLLLDGRFEAELRSLVEKYDIRHLVHAAGRINGTPVQLAEANEGFTGRLLDAMKPYADTMRIVFLSTVSAIQPLGDYGESKRRAESAIQSAGFSSWIFLRPSLVYGKHDSKNIALLSHWIRKFPIVPILGGKRATVQPLYVGDLYGVVKQCLDRNSPSTGVFTVAGPRQEKIWDIADAIRRRLERRVWLVPVPLMPVRWAASVLRVLAPSSRLPVQQIRSMHVHAPWDSSDAKAVFGFSPRLFEQGLKEIL